MFPPDFSARLTSALLDWLWRSWVSLGVSGHGSEARQDRVIDPEALILASSLWARWDARLFDEMLDWLCQHGQLIHLQRLQTLYRRGLGDARVLSAVASVLVEHSSHAKWKSLIAPSPPSRPPEPLFDGGLAQTASWGEPDPLFLRQGFQRGRLQLRQLSQPPDPRRAPNLWLKLRALFGTSARAEIWLYLLTQGPGTAAEIARFSGYTPRSILLPLREMALSGHLHESGRPPRARTERGKPAPVRTRGPSLKVALQSQEWSFLRTWQEPEGYPRLEPVAPLLRLCHGVLEKAQACPAGSKALQSLQLREAVAPALAEIHGLGLSGIHGLAPDLSGERLVSTLTDRLPATVQSL